MKLSYTCLFMILFFNSSSFSQTAQLDSLPVIYIPGIMGSPMYNDLNDDNKLTWNEKAWIGTEFGSMHLDTNGIDPLFNQFNIKVAPIMGDTANTLRDEFEGEPLNLFKGFFDNMEVNGYILDDNDYDFSEGENLFCFSYDWRKDNAYNAELLSEFIDSVMIWTNSDQVNLVGHSMGGIVAKTFVKLFDESRVKKLVFIGTPHLGAPEVLTVMLTGKLFEWLNNFASNYYFRLLGRNLPSCYQLIPTRSYFDLTLNNGISSGVEVYSECFQLLDGSYLTYDELIDYLRDYELPLGEDLNDFLLDNSEIFKEDIDTVDFGEVQVFNIVGANQLTIGLNKEVELVPGSGIIIIEDVRNLNGDYTVPLRSAELINGRVFENTYYLSGMIHSAVPSSESALEILLGVFNDPPITSFPQYSEPPESYRTVTDVSDEFEIISSFYLSQNYPNPFNPVTKIEYQVPSFSHVTLKLYDILGNEIATLVDGEKSFGVYELTFFAGNLPSGVYFYQLKTQDPSTGSGQRFVETKKMILMK